MGLYFKEKGVCTVRTKTFLVTVATFARNIFMAHLQSIAILFILILALGTTVSANEQESSRTDLVVIPGNGVNGCLSVEDRQAARQLLHSVSNQVLQNYNNNPNCGPGLWRRVFYFNINNEDQSCPGYWNSRTHQSVRGCAGAAVSCQSAFSGDINTAYNKVCGRVIGIGSESPDAFYRVIPGQTTIEHIYLDGVSVTHGAPGSRTHIWSFGAGHPTENTGSCPCDSSNRIVASLPPSEVGENYFCATTYPGDRLWSGSDCNTASSCCSFHNPPYFSVQLPTPTTDQIELRICTDETFSNEPVLVLFADMYVQ